MLNLLDDVLRAVLVSGWAAPPNAPNFSFAAPDEAFRTRVDSATLNVYLAEIRENRDFRRPHYDAVRLADQSSVLAQPPAYFDCHYLISAWSATQESDIASPTLEEHGLLGRALWVLLRNPDVIPAALGVVGGGQVFQGAHVYLTVAPPDAPRVVNDFWSAMKQPWRPTISLIATVPIDPESDSPNGPPVVTFVQRSGQIGADPGSFSELIAIGGWVLRQSDSQPIVGATVRRISTGEEVRTDAQGRFAFTGLTPGIHRFRAVAPNLNPLERDLDIPTGPAEDHVFRLT